MSMIRNILKRVPRQIIRDIVINEDGGDSTPFPALWLDSSIKTAGNIGTQTDRVILWKNLGSAANCDGTMTLGATTRPYVNMAANEGIRFPNTPNAHYLNCNYLPPLTGVLFALVEPLDAGMVSRIFYGSPASSSGSHYIGINAAGNYQFASANRGLSDASLDTGVPAVQNQKVLLVGVFGNGRFDGYVNGGAPVIDNITVNTTPPVSSVRIGHYKLGGSGANHAEYEIREYEGALTIPQINEIGAEIAAKFSGVTWNAIPFDGEIPFGGMGQSLIASIQNSEIQPRLNTNFTPKRAIWLNRALSGTALMEENYTVGAGYFWVNAGNNGLAPLAVTSCDVIKNTLIGKGKTVYDLPLIMWALGNQDMAALIPGGIISPAQYEASLRYFFSEVRKIFPNVKFQLANLSKAPTADSSVTRGAQAVREVYQKIIGTEPYLLGGPEGYHLPQSDGVHYTPTGRAEIAVDHADWAAANLGLRSHAGLLGPITTGVTGKTTSTWVATLQHDLGTDFSFPNGDPKIGMRAEDSGGVITINSVTRLNATQYAINLARNSTGTGDKFYTLYGGAIGMSQTAAEVMMDNQAKPRPLRPTNHLVT